MRGHATDSRNAAGTFFLGVACGAAVGAAVALLYAPKSGADLRSDLANRADELKRAAAVKYDSAISQIDRMVEKGRRVVKDGQDTVRMAAEEFADAASAARQDS